jgi:hypothetical protein
MIEIMSREKRMRRMKERRKRGLLVRKLKLRMKRKNYYKS